MDDRLETPHFEARMNEFLIKHSENVYSGRFWSLKTVDQQIETAHSGLQRVVKSINEILNGELPINMYQPMMIQKGLYEEEVKRLDEKKQKEEEGNYRTLLARVTASDEATVGNLVSNIMNDLEIEQRGIRVEELTGFRHQEGVSRYQSAFEITFSDEGNKIEFID